MSRSESREPRESSLGLWLRTQREARGVTLREIADDSKISLRYLEALESDRFDALPAEVFVRGFLREYARVVGLDPDEVVNLYLVAAPGESPDPAPVPRRAAAASRPSYALYGALIAGALALLLAAALAISWWAGRRSNAGRHEVTGAAGAEYAGAESREGLERSTTSAPAPEIPEEIEVDAPPAAAPETSPAGDAAGPEAALRLVLDFSQDCWVEVAVDGRRRPSELKAGGESLALEAERSIVLTLGNAPAVRAELNGRPFQLPNDGSRVVRELRIERSPAVVPAVEPPAS
jgi:cytoskeleton protein RodZ